MKWMYLFGDNSKWYYNWVLFIFAFTLFIPLAAYMLYRTFKDIADAAKKAEYERTLEEEVREEARLEELRKIREAIEKK